MEFIFDKDNASSKGGVQKNNIINNIGKNQLIIDAMGRPHVYDVNRKLQNDTRVNMDKNSIINEYERSIEVSNEAFNKIEELLNSVEDPKK